MKINLDTLFPVPILLSYDIYKFSEQEFNILNGQEKQNNISNYISINKNVLDHKNLKNFRRWIYKNVDVYVKQVFRFLNVEPYITQSWVNWTELHQKHERHKHANSFVSGIVFLSDDDAPVSFYRPATLFNLSPEVDEYDMVNCEKFNYPTKKGKMLIFPSTLEHEVPLQTVDKTRISLSFNTWLKGKVGTERDATYLDLFTKTEDSVKNNHG